MDQKQRSSTEEVLSLPIQFTGDTIPQESPVQDIFEHRITFLVFCSRESALPCPALEMLPQTSAPSWSVNNMPPTTEQLVGSALKSIRTITSHISQKSMMLESLKVNSNIRNITYVCLT